MRPIDHTLKDHDARKHERIKPYQFHRDVHTTWKVQVPESHVAHVQHADGRITQHECGCHETPKGATLVKMERVDGNSSDTA